MAPNIGFANSPATLSSDGTLEVSGPSDPVFVAAGAGVEGDEGTLVARSVAVQQGAGVFGGPASLGASKSWSALIETTGLQEGPASASGVEVYAFEGAQSPLLVTFTWSQDIVIKPKPA